MPPYGSQADIVNPNPNKPILEAEQINAIVDFFNDVKVIKTDLNFN
jgi:hypothetical protein